MQCWFAPTLALLILIPSLRWCLPISFTIKLFVTIHWEDTLKPGIYLSPLKNVTTSSSIYGWFLSEPIFTVMVAKWWFSNPIILLHLQLAFYHREALSRLSIYPLTHLFISSCVHGFLFYSVVNQSITITIYLILKVSQICPVGPPSQCPLNVFPPFFEYLLTL